jgi:putative glutamine amidotransferase
MKKRILVLNGPGYAQALKGLAKQEDFTTDIAEFIAEPKDFMLVMFTGGADVSPELYGQTSPKQMCHINPDRDVKEMEIFKLALVNDIAMTGICRGSQFLNAMCGGVMMHHVSHHRLGGTHTMKAHNLEEAFNVTSTHHQMCIPGDKGFIVGWSEERRSNVYIGDKDVHVEYDGPEVEAVYYPASKVFAVQYHPEYMDKNSVGYAWYKQGVADLLEMSKEDFANKYLNEDYSHEQSKAEHVGEHNKVIYNSSGQ